MTTVAPASWLPSLLAVLSANVAKVGPAARFLQLATINVTATRPHVRTVVFRGLLLSYPSGSSSRSTLMLADHLNDPNELKEDASTSLVFATDLRSDKIAQLAASPRVEACWYFAHTRQQFRLAGAMRVVPGGDSTEVDANARAALWNAQSSAAKRAYATTGPIPGAVVPPDFSAESSSSGNEKDDQPSPHFGMLVLDVDGVDLLNLGTTPQIRTCWTCSSPDDGSFQVRRVFA
ncbi:hypothetical protein BC828DRAFT_403755 [Blastocladiella britannica]|nr:hypothetical protein BC828DRAFT_403755 [Blastocladiella britannica]